MEILVNEKSLCFGNDINITVENGGRPLSAEDICELAIYALKWVEKKYCGYIKNYTLCDLVRFVDFSRCSEVGDNLKNIEWVMNHMEEILLTNAPSYTLRLWSKW